MIFSEMLNNFDGLYHFFGETFEEIETVLTNGVSISDIHVEPEQILTVNQIHSSTVIRVNSTKLRIPEADGLITNQRGIYLCIRTADCVPLLLYDSMKQVCAAVHSGREGTLKNITGICIAAMQKWYGCEVANIIAGVGPAIIGRNYQVDSNCFNNFKNAGGCVLPCSKLDVTGTVINQLTTCGVTQIEVLPQCTFENEKFYSYRRNQTKLRQATLIGMS
ncbi:MAG: peptidoglycan editing factor PgeF [Candidatus Cloacimonetes bacterium]|nr:peptidoglycan editing factor PgeF [Candidatus Cloacimonadota bacterium]